MKELFSQNNHFSRLLESARRNNSPIILDGAMGTALDDAGVDTSSPLWTGMAPLTHPDLIERIHKNHIEAGARVITTCTFRTTRNAFYNTGINNSDWRKALREAVRIARKASGSRRLIAGSIGPLEDCFRPEKALSGSEAFRAHSVTAQELADAGVDVLWLETFSSRSEVLAAASAASIVGNGAQIPFSVNLVTNAKGDLLDGEPLTEVVEELLELGPSTIGVNCIPHWFVDAALEKLVHFSKIPIAVYTNLGRAEDGQGWKGNASLTPEEYAEKASCWVRNGALLIGGCCGSNASHIATLSKKFQGPHDLRSKFR